MGSVDLQSVNELVLKQEEALQFNSFSNKDAWNLGKLMVEEIDKHGMELTVCIRKLNGNILFQYATEKTNLNNQNWMNRKFNIVSLMEKSSLRIMIESIIKKKDLTAYGLNTSDYVLCGGGFPVKLKNGPMVAIITVSNLPHVQDHGFIVKCLSMYLNIKDIPEISLDI